MGSTGRYTNYSRSQTISSILLWNSQQATGQLTSPPKVSVNKKFIVCSLFDVVVDTDVTGQALLEALVKERSGRITCVPLNRIHPAVPSYPNAQDAIPLMEKLQFDPMYLKAFQQVFGKTCVCRDLTIAAAYVKSHGINTITLDGDKVDRKGALTGGFYDVRRSRLEAINSVMSWRTKYTANDKRLKEVVTEITRVEQDVTRIMGRIQVLQNQVVQTRVTRERLAEDATQLEREKERTVAKIEKLEGDVNDLETELAGLTAKLEGYRTEMASPLARGLTADEEALIEELGKDIEQRQKQLLELARTKNDVCVPFIRYFLMLTFRPRLTVREAQKHA